MRNIDVDGFHPMVCEVGVQVDAATHNDGGHTTPKERLIMVGGKDLPRSPA